MSNKMDMCLLITSGNGPGECHQAVAGILGQMRNEAEELAFDLDVSTTPTKHGLKSVVVVLHGVDVEGFANRWCGSIRWRAKSTLRPHHKRANWFVGVFKLKKSVTFAVDILPSDLNGCTSHCRSGGLQKRSEPASQPAGTRQSNTVLQRQCFSRRREA